LAARPKPPVFLARTSYRQRRLRDAARLLPVLGGTLWMIPLLWPRASLTDTNTAQSTSTAVIYIFGVWAALILASFVLSRVLRPDQDSGPEAEGRDRDGRNGDGRNGDGRTGDGRDGDARARRRSGPGDLPGTGGRGAGLGGADIHDAGGPGTAGPGGT